MLDIAISIANKLSVNGASYRPSDVSVPDYECLGTAEGTRQKVKAFTIKYLALVLVRDGNVEAYGFDDFQVKQHLIVN